MSNRDWERFGEEICRNVQDAIDSKDYSMLNRTIMDTMNGAVDYFSHTVRNAGNAVNENIRNQQEEAFRRHQEERARWQQEETRRQEERARWQQEETKRQEGRYRYAGSSHTYSSTTFQRQRPAGQDLTRYASTTMHKVIGILLAVCGMATAIPFLLTVLMGIFMGIFAGDPEAGIVIAASLPFMIVGGGIGIWGINMFQRTKRFQAYIRVLGQREYCDVKELQEHLGKSKKYIVIDLEKMIHKGWFREGHLDSKQSCLMVSHQAYEQYHELMDRVEEQKQEQLKKEQEEARMRQAKEEAAKGNPNLPPEVRETILAGEEYLRQIKACNDAIPGEEISAKISRIEIVVDKIFDRVEDDPSSVSDLRRMMEYYLPTTVKLLKAYEDLDAQPIQGENILTSKKEIEDTLDTLNVAFEKLLDGLFQSTAWDVSSDISVLHTMLAQEGLTDDGLKK